LLADSVRVFLVECDQDFRVWKVADAEDQNAVLSLVIEICGKVPVILAGGGA